MKLLVPKKGLTLIELMVTIAAAAILILIVATVLIMAYQSWRINNAYVDLRRDSAFAFSMMARDVREADDVTPGNTLELNYPAALGKPAVSYTKNGSQFDYNDGSETITLIPTNVTLFSSSGGDDGVLLTLVLKDEVYAGGYTITLTNQVFVNTRN